MSSLVGQRLTDKLADKLVEQGLITNDQLTVARVSQKNLGEELGHILIRKGFVSENQLLSFLGRSLSIPFVSLKKYQIQQELVQKVPVHMARRYHLIPLRQEDNEVIVAMADPLDRFAIDDVRMVLNADVRPVLSSIEEIDGLIQQHYGRQLNSIEQEVQIEGTKFSFEEAFDTSGEKLEKIATGPKVIQTVNQIIAQAYQSKASDIHIEPRSDAVHIRYRIDGLLEERLCLSREMQLPIVSRIKILGRLDIAERRIPQDGRTRIMLGGNPLDIRVSTLPTIYGEKVVLRLLAKDASVSIESLGFSEKDRKIFADLINRSHGIFLVTGPTGSGKSTTLYAALTHINSPDRNIVSIEDPVESEMVGVNQAQINTKAGVTFASALRSILRQDPDVIMIGEIRDGETAEIAVRAAITGHLVLSTLHTNSAAGTISRLQDLGVESFLLSSALIGVLAQRLVRKICPQCRVEFPPNPEYLQLIGQKVKKNFRGQGCSACRMSGYSGRIGIFELAPMGEEVRKLIGVRASDKEIEKELRRLGVQSLLDNGLDKVEKGLTTLDELIRVTQEE